MKEFIETIQALDNETLLERFTAGQAEEKENFLNAEWRKDVLPFVEALRNEVLKRMGGRK